MINHQFCWLLKIKTEHTTKLLMIHPFLGVAEVLVVSVQNIEKFQVKDFHANLDLFRRDSRKFLFVAQEVNASKASVSF